MTTLIEATLKLTFGLFWDKARRKLDENLKDGDLNSQKLRNLIMSNMDDLKTKLDGIARRELLSSASFIQEGLFLLNNLLDELHIPVIEQQGLFPSVKVFHYIVRFKNWLERSGEPEDASMSLESAEFPEIFRFCSRSASQLMDAISKYKNAFSDDFKTAMKCFEDAHTRATDAFFNESLTIEDRIMAAKLRVQSRLLLSLERPSLAKVCKAIYVKDMHDLPAVAKTFRYHLEGGVLLQFSKSERQELVQSVSLINFVVFRFLNSLTEDPGRPVNVYDWPLIEDDTWTYNPLIPSGKVIEELRRARLNVPNLVPLKPIESRIAGMDPKLVAIDTDGNLILFRQQTSPDVCELLRVAGDEVEVFYTFPEFTLVSFVACMRDSGADYLCVFADNVEEDIPPGYVMYDVFVLYPFGSFSPRHEKVRRVYKRILLPDDSAILVPTPQGCGVALRVPDQTQSLSEKIRNGESGKARGEEKTTSGEENTQGEESIHGTEDTSDKEEVVGERNTRGEDRENEGEDTIPAVENLRSKEKIPAVVLNIPDSCLVEIKMSGPSFATVTDTHKVIAIKHFGYVVRVFEKDGRFVREFELRGGESEACIGITFNYLTKEIVVVSRFESGYFLSAYLLETGERSHFVKLAHLSKDYPASNIHLTSHCSGAMALISKEHILYLQ